MQKVKFERAIDGDFFKILTHRVDAYFKTNKISKKSNWLFIFKNLSYFLIAVVLYALILSGYFFGWQLVILFISFGLFITTFLFSIAHDASHNAISDKQWVNQLFAYIWNLLGISSYFWDLKHNFAHHGFTNIPGMDDDIDQSKLVRLNPNSERKWFHQYQHIYAPFLYALLSINIIYFKDIKMLFQHKFGNKQIDKHPGKEILILAMTKFFFITYMIVIPKVVLGISWMEMFGYHILMHAAIGLFIGLILVPVHVTNDSKYRLPDNEGTVHRDWGTHQIEATVDFAANNYFINWITGGLNTHVVHHLFPTINHIHYYKLTKIIKETATEFNVPYRNHSLIKIFKEHMHFLKSLGRIDNPTSNKQFNHKPVLS
jgi:linoleoyl-CoA desaturase